MGNLTRFCFFFFLFVLGLHRRVLRRTRIHAAAAGWHDGDGDGGVRGRGSGSEGPLADWWYRASCLARLTRSQLLFASRRARALDGRGSRLCWTTMYAVS